MVRGIVAIAIVLAVCLCAQAETVDVLTTTDGKVYEGHVQSKSDAYVVFQVQYASGGTAEMSFDLKKVASITKKTVTPTPKPAPTATPAPTTKPTSAPATAPSKVIAGVEPKAPPIEAIEGPSYYVIPIKGVIGTSVKNKFVEKSIEDAAARKPTVIILDVESPGGMASEMSQIIETIRKNSEKQRVVVLAGEAFSAAAVISLTSKEIYMKPAGKIGAALVVHMSDYGLMPVNEDPAVREKIESTMRAEARSAAQAGGHDSLLAEGMMYNQLELNLTEKDSKKVIREGKGDKMILRKGQLLTMTADEAVDYGLAVGKAGDYDQLGKALGYEGWKECKGLGTLLADYWKKTMDKIDADMKKLVEEYTTAIKNADENHPDNRSFTWEVDRDTNRFSPSSLQLWRKQCGLTLQALAKAEKALKDQIALLSKYEEFESIVDHIKKRLDNIQRSKREMERMAQKVGP